MSDYEQSRYARSTHPVDTGGVSAFWALVVVVALGALVLIIAIGGATTGTIQDTSGAEAPVIAPAEPAPTGASATATE